MTHLLIDHDTKYARSFDAVFEGEGAEVKRVGPRAPNMNAYAERWVQTLRQECLDHFLVLGAEHLGHLVKEFVAHYNAERPHQARGRRAGAPDSHVPDRRGEMQGAARRTPEALLPQRGLSHFSTNHNSVTTQSHRPGDPTPHAM